MSVDISKLMRAVPSIRLKFLFLPRDDIWLRFWWLVVDGCFGFVLVWWFRGSLVKSLAGTSSYTVMLY